MPESRLVGLVLAGGASRRMGRDKAWLEWEGVPLWQWMERLLWQAGADEVWFSRAAGQSEMPERIVKWDQRRDGPVPAVLDALKAARDQGALGLLVVAVDMPLLNPAWLARLVVPSRAACASTDQGLQPFPCWIPTEMADCPSKGGGMGAWLRSVPLRPIAVDKDEESPFLPGNTPADWAALRDLKP